MKHHHDSASYELRSAFNKLLICNFSHTRIRLSTNRARNSQHVGTLKKINLNVQYIKLNEKKHGKHKLKGR